MQSGVGYHLAKWPYICTARVKLTQETTAILDAILGFLAGRHLILSHFHSFYSTRQDLIWSSKSARILFMTAEGPFASCQFSHNIMASMFAFDFRCKYVTCLYANDTWRHVVACQSFLFYETYVPLWSNRRISMFCTKITSHIWEYIMEVP